ncbi:MAG TPA: sensor domain-containing diguanylate cyclase [Nitrospiraceae bacterium]|nr:sensor domain-containing diguanylate cyclase [Nitrospiraceae bacterium]
MPNVFLIGPGLNKRNFEDILSRNGFEVSKFSSIETALSRLDEKADVLIIEKEQYKNKSFKKFLKASAEIPKLIVSLDYSFRGFAVWLKESLTRPVYNPLEKELLYFIRLILKEKNTREENKTLRQELDTANKEIEFFEDVGKTLTSSLELNKILVAVMRKTKEIIGAEAWSVLVVDETTGDLVFERADTKKVEKYRLKPGEGIAGWVAQEGIPVIVPDVSLDKRFSSRVDKQTHFKTRSLMCVPIKSQGRVIGVLEVVNKVTGEPFTKEDLNLLMRLVDQAALTIERTTLYQKMAELVVTDDLTKLFNTRYLNRTIETEIQRSNRYKTSISLIFIDIDYFKNINDQHGHLIGSKILVELGQLIIKCLRSIDIVARYGGDEFVVVLPQTPPHAAVQIAERIRKSVEHNTFLKKEGYALKMTASFGVASYPESAKTKEDLIRLADEAMYRVKNTTRNGVYAIV